MAEKRKRAVGLAYDMDETAPKVVAKGEGLVAENIIRLAENSNITIYEDEKLLNNLIQLEINEEIPEELYEAVAEIIFYIYSLDNKKKGY